MPASFSSRGSYLPAHLLLLGRVDLDVFAERAGVRVALGAAGDLAGVRLLWEERTRLAFFKGQSSEDPDLTGQRRGNGEGAKAKVKVLPLG